MAMLQQPARSSQPLFCSVTRTQKELSILISAPQAGALETQHLKTQLMSTSVQESDPEFGYDGPWTAFRIRGPMEFHLVGVMAEFSRTLAAHAISLFAVSTWDTDYICVKKDQAQEARQVLTRDGWNVFDHAE